MKRTPRQLLDAMTLRQKIGQTVQIILGTVPFDSADHTAEFFERYPVGSLFAGPDVINTFGAPLPRLDAIERCRAASALPISVAGDLERGYGRAAFPAELALGAARDPGLAYEYGRWTAIEGRRCGFNWAFAPVGDLALNWLNPLVIPRCPGNDPELVAELVAQIVRGMQENHLSAAVKHFPGDGVDCRDQHLSCSINSLSREEWMASFGCIYRRAFAAGADSIMSGHISLPFMDPGDGELPPPATLSAPIQRDLLRGELGFRGVVVSDALIMAGFVMHKPYARRIVATFKAGTDVLLWPELNYFELMECAVESGEIAGELLDESVLRILTMKAHEGLLDETPPAVEVPDADPVALADHIAERGAVLKRNRHHRIPFPAQPGRKILLWFATGYADDWERRYRTLIAGFEARGAVVTVTHNGNCLDLRKREEAGERYDEVVFIFDPSMHQVKNAIRPTGPAGECLWTLSCCEAHDPVVVALNTPFLLRENPALPTLVDMNSDGEASQRAVARLLWGEVPFSGTDPIR